MNNKKILLSVFWIVLGIILFVLSSMQIIDSEYFSGMGGGLIAIGIMQILSYVRYKKDENYRRKVNISQNDERLKFLQMKAWVITGKITILGLAITSVVCFIIHQSAIQEFALFAMCAMTLIYTAVFYILGKKY